MPDLGYNTYDVIFEHTTPGSDNVNQNRAVVTVYGDGGEFKLRSEIMRQNSGYTNVNIIDVTRR